MIDGEHLPALVERFVVGVFVFTLNFLYTFMISIFRPIKLSRHFLQKHNENLVLSSPVTYITVAVFITQVLMVELYRFDSNNQIKDVVIGSTNQFFTDVLFQFLPKIVFLFVLLVLLAKLGEKLCNQPKANLFRLMCYLYGSVLIFIRSVNQTISTYGVNFEFFGLKVDSTVYRNALESIQHPIDFGLSEYDDFYIHLGYSEVYLFLYFFVAIAIGNGQIFSMVKKLGTWLRFVLYWGSRDFPL